MAIRALWAVATALKVLQLHSSPAQKIEAAHSVPHIEPHSTSYYLSDSASRNVHSFPNYSLPEASRSPLNSKWRITDVTRRET